MVFVQSKKQVLSYYKWSPYKLSPQTIIATMHGPLANYEGGQGLGFRYIILWLAGLVSRVCMAGLDSSVCTWQGYFLGSVLGGPNTAQWTVWGDHNFGGTIDSVTPK